VVYFTRNIPPPSNVNNLFGNWLNMIDKKTKTQICVGVCALVWQFGIVKMLLF
jgi:exosome complex RNA-binding protein Rrp4